MPQDEGSDDSQQMKTSPGFTMEGLMDTRTLRPYLTGRKLRRPCTSKLGL